MPGDAERIAVAVCTRHRPRMLSNLMTSLQNLDVPQGSELLFLFVENNSVLSISDQVVEFSKWTGWQARAVHAPDPGIVNARNAAVEAALKEGARWLAFVDDDEQVRHDWLRTLWSGAREAGAQLAGGPVKPVAPAMRCTDAEMDVLNYYVRSAEQIHLRKEAAARAGRRFDLVTNNWIFDLQATEKAGLRFDMAFNLSGGSDTDFSRRARAAGLKLAWIPGAIVTEEMPQERLTSTNLFDRARDQTMVKLKMSYGPHSAIYANAGLLALSKTLVGVLNIAMSPLLGKYHYFRGVRSLGIAAGYVAGLRGLTQERYTEISGD